MNPRPDRFEPITVPVGQDIFPLIDHTSTQTVLCVGVVNIVIG